MEANEKRNKWLTTRLTQAEYDEVVKHFDSTTERKISTFVRKTLLKKPMIGLLRNLNHETQLQEFSAVVKILNGVANNFNQMVHRLHLIKGTAQMQELFLKQELDKRKLMNDINEMKTDIKHLVDSWLQ